MHCLCKNRVQDIVIVSGRIVARCRSGVSATNFKDVINFLCLKRRQRPIGGYAGVNVITLINIIIYHIALAGQVSG